MLKERYDLMEKEFLEYVKRLKESGLSKTISLASSKRELKQEIRKFRSKNRKFIKELKVWAKKWAKNRVNGEYVFFSARETEESKNIENPMEIVLCIYFMQNKNVSECEIFQNFIDLQYSLINSKMKVAEAIAYLITTKDIKDINAHDIFLYYEIFDKKEAIKGSFDEDDDEDVNEDENKGEFDEEEYEIITADINGCNY